MLAFSAAMCCGIQAAYICPLVLCEPCRYPNVQVNDRSGCPTCKCRNPCKHFKCPKRKPCEVDFLSRKPACVCPSLCIAVYAPVCGSDGKTYSNSCHLGVYNCQFNKKVTIVSDGPCGSTEKNNI